VIEPFLLPLAFRPKNAVASLSGLESMLLRNLCVAVNVGAAAMESPGTEDYNFD
jgi:hypothetical protein